MTVQVDVESELGMIFFFAVVEEETTMSSEQKTIAEDVVEEMTMFQDLKIIIEKEDAVTGSGNIKRHPESSRGAFMYDKYIENDL